MRLHLVDVHHEDAQTEAEGSVDGAEHEVEREHEKLRVRTRTRRYEDGREHGKVVIEADEHGVQEGSDGLSRELDGEHVERQLCQPQQRRDDTQDAQNQLRDGKQRVVLLVVHVLRAQLQIVLVQLLAGSTVFRRGRFGFLLQATLLLPTVVAVLCALRHKEKETALRPSSG